LISGKTSSSNSLFRQNFHGGKVLEGKLIQRKLSSGKLSAGKTFVRKTYQGKTFVRGKLLSGKLIKGKLLSGENFHGETFIQKTSTGIPSHPQKLSGTEERGTVPEKMEFGWCLFWIMTILKILEIHHLTQLYKGKVRNDCGLYSGQGKLSRQNLSSGKLFGQSLFSRKLLQRGVNHPVDSRVHP